MGKLERLENIGEGVGGNTEKPPPRPLQHLYWCFTWNNFNDVEKLETIFKHECDWFVFQEERGENGTLHLQGTIKLKKKQRLTDLKKWNNSIHWESTKCVSKSIAYCSKEATRQGKQWIYGIEMPEAIDIEEPYGWQLQVMDIIKSKPDKRTIHWFWEKTGNVGKTTLCKYLVVKYGAIILSGKSTDMYHALSKAKNKNIILIDVPRTAVGYINYGAIESIKNGLIFSGKYEGCQLVFNCPHVIVFSNEKPDTKALSEDRWNIVNIRTTPDYQQMVSQCQC